MSAGPDVITSPDLANLAEIRSPRILPGTERVILLAVTVGGGLLRLHFLGAPMRGDESVTYLRFVSQPLARALSDYSLPNNHLFHTLLAHISVRLFGNHPWALRLPAFLAGVAIIPCAYFALRKLYGSGAGLVAAGLVASSAALVDFSTNARGYSLLVCASLVLVWAACSLAEDEKRRSAWALYVLSIVVGTYTVPSMILVWAIVGIWLVLAYLNPDRRARFASFSSRLILFSLMSAIAIAGLYLPVVRASGLHAVTSAVTFIQHVHSSGTALRITTTGLIAQWKVDFSALLLALLAAGVLVSVVWHRRLRQITVPHLFATAVIISALYVALERIVAWQRMLVFLLPIFFVTGCAGLLALIPARARRWVSLAAALAVTITLGAWVFVAGNIQKNPETIGSVYPEGLPVSRFLAQNLESSDRVVVFGNRIGQGTSHADQVVIPYYFTELVVSPTHLQGCCLPTERIWIVAPAETGGAEARAWVTRHGASRWGPPQLIRVIGGSGIFRFDPRTGT